MAIVWYAVLSASDGVARPEYLLEQGRVGGHEERVLGDRDADRALERRRRVSLRTGGKVHGEIVDRGPLELALLGSRPRDLEAAA